MKLCCARRGQPGTCCVRNLSRARFTPLDSARPGSLLGIVACCGRQPSRLAVAVVLLLVGAAADIASTYVAISGGRYVEGSPVGAAFIAAFGLVPGMVLTKAAGMAVIGVPVAVAGGTRRLVATLMCAGVGVLSIATAVRNVLFVTGVWP